MIRRTKCQTKPGKEVAASNPQVPTSERDWTPYYIIGGLIAASEGPELIRAFWKAINKVSILDPTCVGRRGVARATAGISA